MAREAIATEIRNRNLGSTKLKQSGWEAEGHQEHVLKHAEKDNMSPYSAITTKTKYNENSVKYRKLPLVRSLTYYYFHLVLMNA